MSTRHPSQQIAQRDRLVLDHLLSIADSEGRLSGSTYAIACELGLHRQTLSRILRRLAKTGTIILNHHACTPIRVTENVTEGVTAEAEDVTPPVTEVPTGAIISWTITYSLSYQPGYVMRQPKDVTVSDCNNAVSDDNKETKQKNEEIPPAPPKEEKKQKKENSPSPACARKEISAKTDEERLEQRRQRFIDTLQPFADRYGEEMIRQFADYWTETNRSNTRMRFELQRTWNTSLRLARWARNDYAFNQPSFNSNYHDNHNNYHHRSTSADYIREAQQWAIEQSIRAINSPRKQEESPSPFPF